VLERINSVFLIVFGWLVVVPVALLFPKKKGLIISIGREGNDFTDNVKYFHSYLIKNQDKKNSFYLAETDAVSEQVPNIVHHPSIKSCLLLLRADVVVIDTSDWFYRFKYHLAIKARIVQLWHGVGSKKIELATKTFTESRFRKLAIFYGILRGQFSKYHFISSTSEYYSNHLYKDAFRYKSIKEFGQPRNDVLFRKPDELDLIGTDKDVLTNLIRRKESDGVKLVLFTPTFRHKLDMNLLDLKMLDQFALDSNFVFVIKHHLLTTVNVSQKYDNIVYYNKYKDIYPLMSISDAMITDYSSIYLDYLLLDKPIIFYVPDFEEYKNADTSLRDDFLDIAPGTKCNNQEKLHNALLEEVVNKKDSNKEMRESVLRLSYKYADGDASKRIYEYLTIKKQ